MCIAGVFGGDFSGVTENTSSIFLESAYFDPISVRKTAKRHGLNTDASFRFERGVDIEMSEYALKRAAVLIKEIAGGEISSEVVDLYPKKPKERQVFLTFDKINFLIGQEIPRDTIKSILTALEIKVNNVTESGLGLTIPFYRVDVEREVDVIEEILRVYGYNNIDFKEKLNASIAKTQKREPHRVQDQIASLLVAQGFYEIMTNSLVAGTLQNAVDNKAKPVHMLNPLSNDMGILRTNMLISGLDTVLYNLNRQKLRGKFFEFGKTYQKNGDGYDEKMHLSLFVFGQKNQQNWNTQNAPTDFFFVKGLVEGILERNGVSNYTSESIMDEKGISEGVTLKHQQKALVSYGLVDKTILKEVGIKTEVFFADFDWDNVSKLMTSGEVLFKEIPKYPAVTRDLALLLDNSVSFEAVESIAWKTERKLLKSVTLFDVYTGKNLPENKKSYAVSFTLQDENKTLTDKQIDKIMGKLQVAFERDLSASLR